MRKNHGIWPLFVLVFALFALVFLSFPIGRYPISITGFFDAILGKNEQILTVIVQIRLPRIFAAVAVGGGLSIAGAAYQSAFRNPMASPDVLGASSGAAFGAAAAILCGLGGGGVTFFAFVAGLLTVLLTMAVGKAAKGGVLTLILTGMMVSSLLSAGLSILKLAADPGDELQSITYWLMGSLAGTRLSDLPGMLIPMAIGIAVLLLFRRQLDLLALGDEEAKSLGAEPGKLRLILLMAASLITAAAIACAGTIGWVGLIVPHLTIRLLGGRRRYLLPGCILFGGCFLLLADNIARTVFPTELPIGILTAVVGAPFFIGLMTSGAVRGGKE